VRTAGKCAWLAGLYVAAGVPFGFLTEALPARLRFAGVPLGDIASVAFWTGLPWTFKFAWSPVVERFGARRTWAAACLLAGAGLLFAGGGSTAIALFVAMAAVSATYDIAVDAYSVELVHGREVGVANGVRVTAYRIGLILAGGFLVARAERWGWGGTTRGVACAMAVLGVAAWFLPRTERPVATGVPFVASLRSFRDRAGLRTLLLVALFVFLFKAADHAMAPMVKPFLVDAGLSAGEIGDLQTPLSVVFTIAGALAGGALTTRWGIFRALWILGLLQGLSNLGYAAAAHWPSRPLLWGAIAFEPFCGGLGTAAFLAFLMAACEVRYAATQYALLTALFALARSLLAKPSGELAEAWGYDVYFAATALAAAPAFALLPAVRRWLTLRP
jgi:PAT family beta-lactamase induction signal transducer AmpG